MTENDVTVVEDDETMLPAEQEDEDLNIIPDNLLEEDDPTLLPSIRLPTMDETTISKVQTALKGSYDNFSCDPEEDMSKRFSSVDEVASYASRTIKDIRDQDFKTESYSRTRKGAAMARLWWLCKTFDDVLSNGNKYGARVAEKLAAQLHLSKPYIYQLRTVYKRLSLVQAYLLGTRNIGTSVVRSIARIKDDTTRNTVLNEFFESYRDTANLKERDSALKKLRMALQAYSGKPCDELVANPTAELAQPSETTNEYEGVMTSMRGVSKMVARLASQESINNFEQYASNYFMREDTPGAEAMHQQVIEFATNLLAQCIDAQGNLEQIIQQLESLRATPLLKDDE